MKKWLSVILLVCPPAAQAFHWDDLWHTHNQQARQLMAQQQFPEASERFTDPHWRATAAYRAGHYKDAAAGFQTIGSADGFYNQGNALAQTGEYKEAIQAYDKALKINPQHADAKFNRELIKNFLKKQQDQKKQNQDKQNQDKQNQDKQNQDKQNQDKQNQDKQNQDKQNQDKQNQDKQNQDKQNQDKQNQDKQNQDKQNQDKQNQDKQNQDKQNQDKQNQDKKNQDKQNQDKQNQDKQNQDKQNQDKQNQDKQNQDKQNQDKQNQDKQNQDKQNQAMSSAEKEKRRAKDQWPKLIPDDPGGLMRQKFLRDHLRRQSE